MSREPFQPTRNDGRSDWQVIRDLIDGAPPDTVFTYSELVTALLAGLEPEADVDRRRVYRAIGSANRHLLRDQRRYLGVVRGIGYRVIRADEHLPVALSKKSAAVEQLARGVDLLRHVKLDEIPEAQRKLHEGQLLIMAGLHSAMVESERRHQRQEEIIERIKAQQEESLVEIRERLEALEQPD